MSDICIFIDVSIRTDFHTTRLENAGFSIGQRVIELVSCRDRVTKRETRIVNMLQVIIFFLCKILVISSLSVVYFKCGVEIPLR